jgi:hypothetical protein
VIYETIGCSVYVNGLPVEDRRPPARTRDLCIMACVFCRDPAFLRWLGTLGPTDGYVFREASAKAFILTLCEIESRNDLDTNPDAADRFHRLIRAPFLTWKEANP